MDLAQEIEQLTRASVGELRVRYQELFAEVTRSRHRTFLLRRVAWRLQSLAEGDLSERALRRAREIVCDADLRLRPPRELSCAAPAGRMAASSPRAGTNRDPRLPAPGTLLTRTFRGRTIEVKVLEEGFEYDRQHYGSLSAIATHVTGTRWNGLTFFALK